MEKFRKTNDAAHRQSAMMVARDLRFDYFFQRPPKDWNLTRAATK
jgi:hypothetical protein